MSKAALAAIPGMPNLMPRTSAMIAAMIKASPAPNNQDSHQRRPGRSRAGSLRRRSSPSPTLRRDRTRHLPLPENQTGNDVLGQPMGSSAASKIAVCDTPACSCGPEAHAEVSQTVIMKQSSGSDQRGPVTSPPNPSHTPPRVDTPCDSPGSEAWAAHCSSHTPDGSRNPRPSALRHSHDRAARSRTVANRLLGSLSVAGSPGPGTSTCEPGDGFFVTTSRGPRVN
jgi:hypothetical protein